jgi:hypothetical protein
VRTASGVSTDDCRSVTVVNISVRVWFIRAFQGIGVATHLLMMWKFGFRVYWIRFKVELLIHKCQLRLMWFLCYFEILVVRHLCLESQDLRARGSVVGWGTLCYKPEGLVFDSLWGHWIFQLTKSFQLYYRLGEVSASNRNEYQEFFWGYRAISA